jgi:acetoacetyl-CoA synthetase
MLFAIQAMCRVIRFVLARYGHYYQPDRRSHLTAFAFVYDKIKPDLQLCSISGGTDIVSCFVLGCPVQPVFAGEIQTRGLGMKTDVLDEDGTSLIGKQGELCCTAPFPAMPVKFWNDPDGSKYKAAYFEHFQGIWRHGDWATMTCTRRHDHSWPV